MLKVCRGCGATGYEHYPSIKTYCKTCWRRQVSANRASKPGYYRAYDRSRAGLAHRKVMAAKITASWQRQFPQRRAAHIAVGNAVRDGKLLPLPCLMCGEKAEAHHPDYTLPLDVVWLCPAHHKQAHAMARAA